MGFIYGESVYVLIYADVLHADVFSRFIIWEQIYIFFVFPIFCCFYTQLEITKGKQNSSENIARAMMLRVNMKAKDISQ